MGIRGQLREVQDQLINDLKKTTIPLRRLGEKYGVSYQAIFLFRQGKRIKRPKKEHTENCQICQGLLQIAKQEHSDFISSPTIQKQLKINPPIFRYHLGILRRKGLITKRFGKLRSTRLEQAYQIYFKKGLPVKAIGWEVGLNNFGSILRQHKVSGWDVPDPLFVYDGNARSVRLKIRRKRKGRTEK